MSAKMQLTAKLDQRLVMSQQLTQAITLLQYTSLDLRQLVKQYIETNPLLEVDDVHLQEQTESREPTLETTHAYEEQNHYVKNAIRQTRHQAFNHEDDVLENYSIPKSLREHLNDQTLICKLNPYEQIIAEAIIDAIDESGYLSMSLTDIQQTLHPHEPPDMAQLENILNIIQTFDPVGVGARNLRECLLIQLEAQPKQDSGWQHAKLLLTQHFDVLGLNNHRAILKASNLHADQYQQAMTCIRQLNPKPGLKYNAQPDLQIEPDLHVKKIKQNWCVFLSDSLLTSIKINTQYHDIIRQNKKHASYEGMNRALQEAQWLIKGLQRRNETLLKVATHIIALQKDFIEYGKSFMKPMNIIDVSQALGLHESTVSRVTTGKYIATPRGLFELKYFFPSYVLTETGAACSDTAVKEYIQEIIGQEQAGQVYSDEAIAGLLKQKGIHIARRTVAKYRDALRILPSYQRGR